MYCEYFFLFFGVDLSHWQRALPIHKDTPVFRKPNTSHLRNCFLCSEVFLDGKRNSEYMSYTWRLMFRWVRLIHSYRKAELPQGSRQSWHVCGKCYFCFQPTGKDNRDSFDLYRSQEDTPPVQAWYDLIMIIAEDSLIFFFFLSKIHNLSLRLNNTTVGYSGGKIEVLLFQVMWFSVYYFDSNPWSGKSPDWNHSL